MIPAVLYKGLMMDLFNPKHAAKAYETEYTLRFDWWFILFSFIEFTTQWDVFH